MDVDVCAGGDSTRRKMDTMGDGALEVVPLELYDSSRAKIDANLRWLFAKAYGIGSWLGRGIGGHPLNLQVS